MNVIHTCASRDGIPFRGLAYHGKGVVFFTIDLEQDFGWEIYSADELKSLDFSNFGDMVDITKEDGNKFEEDERDRWFFFETRVYNVYSIQDLEPYIRELNASGHDVGVCFKLWRNPTYRFFTAPCLDVFDMNRLPSPEDSSLLAAKLDDQFFRPEKYVDEQFALRPTQVRNLCLFV